MTVCPDFALRALFPFSKGKYRIEAGYGAAFLERALPLRQRCFRLGQGDDRDSFDHGCAHVLVVDIKTETVVGCFRLKILPAAQISQSYSAQFYQLERLKFFGQTVMELGRFSLHPDWHDPDILRLAWSAMTRIVDASDVGLLFGCTSFSGVNVAAHAAALRWLAARNLAPDEWRPEAGTSPHVDFARDLADLVPDLKTAMAQMPPLLRSYLAMGGWVSDHAVLDRDLDTLHVFTAVEIAKIPASRARALREIAGEVIDVGAGSA